MTKTPPLKHRLIALAACLVALSVPMLSAQDRSRYRDYRMGDDRQAIAEQSGATPPMARIIPHEPTVLQELEWRPQYFRGAARPSDPVARLTFGFYNDQLFRIVIDYERLRTEGMTEADMVAAISETYGQPSRRVERNRPGTQHAEQNDDLLVACWDDVEYSVTLLRVPDSSAFRMIVASTRLGRLAQAAGAGAVRPDVHEAPQLEVPTRSSDVEDGHFVQRKVRVTNKAAFKP
jgi:hypothetical protein